MLSKNDIKNIKSLELKKFRDEKGLFIAEGHKLVGELSGKFRCNLMVATAEWQPDNMILIVLLFLFKLSDKS